MSSENSNQPFEIDAPPELLEAVKELAARIAELQDAVDVIVALRKLAELTLRKAVNDFRQEQGLPEGNYYITSSGKFGMLRKGETAESFISSYTGDETKH